MGWAGGKRKGGEGRRSLNGLGKLLRVDESGGYIISSDGK